MLARTYLDRNCFKVRRISFVGLGIACFVAAGAFAQEPAAEVPDARNALAGRQSQVEEQVDRLRSQMVRLLRMIEEREPAQAEKLRDALRKDGESDLDRRFEQLIQLLSSDEFADASHKQDALIADLREMLQLLQDSDSALDRLREERESIALARKTLEKLSAAQLQALQRTAELRTQLEIAAKLREQAEALERLAEAQRAKLDPSNQNDPNAEEDKDSTLAEQTAEVSRELEQSAAEASDDRVRRAQRDAAHDAQRAAELMRDAGQSADSQEGDKPNENSAAGRQQAEEAEARLRRAIRRLQEEASRVEKLAGTRDAESQQREIYRAADQLQRDVESNEQSGMPPNVAPALEQAGKQMREAADRLGERNLEQADAAQREALESLENSLDTLDEVLRQIRQEEMEETLGALAGRLRDLLEREEKFREEVLPYRARGDELSREDLLILAKLADAQHEITESTTAVQRIFVDEGTTVVLPQLLETIVADMTEIERATRDARVEDSALRHLDAAIEGLREILAAIEQQQQKNQERAEQGQSAQPQQPGQEALLPGSSELKLLKSSQLRINALTTGLAESDNAEQERYRAAAQR
ncbi:MAG: hypothetical protein AB7N71_09190, partial [Phycisphaerae bacterium]